MNSRLEQFMKAENLSSAKFAEILSVQPSSISHLLSGRNNPNFDFISKLLLMFPQLNPRWIINGQGSMYNDDHEQLNRVSVDKNSDFRATDIFDLETVQNQSYIAEKQDAEQVTVVKQNTNIESEINIPKVETQISRATEPLINDSLTESNNRSTDSCGDNMSKSQRNIERVLLLYNDNTFDYFDHSNR